MVRRSLERSGSSAAPAAAAARPCTLQQAVCTLAPEWAVAVLSTPRAGTAPAGAGAARAAPAAAARPGCLGRWARHPGCDQEEQGRQQGAPCGVGGARGRKERRCARGRRGAAGGRAGVAGEVVEVDFLEEQQGSRLREARERLPQLDVRHHGAELLAEAA
jgi:hypothetical protein